LKNTQFQVFRKNHNSFNNTFNCATPDRKLKNISVVTSIRATGLASRHRSLAGGRIGPWRPEAQEFRRWHNGGLEDEATVIIPPLSGTAFQVRGRAVSCKGGCITAGNQIPVMVLEVYALEARYLSTGEINNKKASRMSPIPTSTPYPYHPLIPSAPNSLTCRPRLAGPVARPGHGTTPSVPSRRPRA